MIRHEVFFPSVQINDLHQEALYQRELSLAKSFVSKIPVSTEIDPCPVSGMQRHEVLFEKWGRRYALCPRTWSLSLGALPDEETVRLYFFDSDLSRYRSSDGYQNTFSQLRKELWSSQVEWIEGRVRRYMGMERYRLTDWGPRMLGWVEGLRKATFVSEYVVKDPLPPLDNTAKADEQSDIVLLFDVIQRSPTPANLLHSVYQSLRAGGLLLLTCRSGAGFDILTLAGESESIFPLDHICLPSPQGMTLLLEQAGFKILELTTPGLLDVQLVRQAGEHIPVHQRFQRYVINQPEQVQERLQGFLQQNNLSSHLRVVAKKPE